MVYRGCLPLRSGDPTGRGQVKVELVTAASILLAVHCLVFWLGIWVAAKCGIEREAQIAVGFSGSQKTLMIGLSTAINLGFSIIPIVLFHAMQLIVDTVFADKLRPEPSIEQTNEPSAE